MFEEGKETAMFQKVATKVHNYQNIVEQIKSMIMAGKLKYGDKLPAERELSEFFGVSRASIREAIKALEVIGIVESRQGEGNFVVDNLDETISEHITLVYTLNNGKIRDILQLRKCLEIESVANIINNCSDSDIEELKKIIDNYNSAKDLETKSVYDIQFHTTILSLSGNVLFIYLVKALSSLINSNIKFISDYVYNRYPEGELDKNHNDIMDAILARDLPEAIRTIKLHYSFSEEEESYILDLNHF